jgi:hypothetical protein
MSKHFLGRIVALFAQTFAMLAVEQGAVNAGTQVACFKVLNASPDAPSLDVYVNRTRVAANLAYTKFSAQRWCYPAAEALVRAFPAGADPNTSQPIGQGSVVLEVERSYVIAVAGLVQPPPGVQGIQIVALQDPGPPPAGQFALRVANLAPNVPSVELVQLPAGNVLIDAVTFPTAKTGTFGAGTYDLILRQTGATTPLFPLGNVTFSAGQRQTVYVFAAPIPPGSAAAALTAGAPVTVNAIIIRDR